jgi:hypothetical protein
MMRWIACLLMLSACIPVVVPVPLPGPAPGRDACGASAMQDLVGQKQSVLAAMSFPAPTRIIQPGMAVTMDYSEARLNIWIGKDGRIERVTCG